MRICMLALDFPYLGKNGVLSRGGAGSCVKQLSDALHARGYDITMISDKHSDYIREVAPYKVMRVPSVYFGIREFKGLSAIPMLFNSCICRSDFDIIHAHNPLAGVAAIPLAKRAHAPLILTMHGHWADIRQKTRPIARKIEFTAIRAADVVSADAYSLERRLKHLYDAKNTVVIPNAIETEMFKPTFPIEKSLARKRLGISDDKFVILYAGRFVREKHIDDLLATIPLVIPKADNALYLLVGGGFDQRIVKRWLADNPSLTKYVKTMPFVSYSEMPKIHAAIDTLVLPTESEAISRSILESMSGAHPTIATAIPDNLELLNRSTGILYPLGDIDALAKAILKLRNSPELCAKLGANARKHVLKHYYVEKRIDAFEKLYEGLVGR